MRYFNHGSLNQLFLGDHLLISIGPTHPTAFLGWTENGGTDVSLDLYISHDLALVDSSVLTAPVKAPSSDFNSIRENEGVIAHSFTVDNLVGERALRPCTLRTLLRIPTD